MVVAVRLLLAVSVTVVGRGSVGDEGREGQGAAAGAGAAGFAAAFARAAAKMSAVDLGAAAGAAAGAGEAVASPLAAAGSAGASAGAGVAAAGVAAFARILERISLVEGFGSVIQPCQPGKKGRIRGEPSDGWHKPLIRRNLRIRAAQRRCRILSLVFRTDKAAETRPFSFLRGRKLESVVPWSREQANPS